MKNNTITINCEGCGNEVELNRNDDIKVMVFENPYEKSLDMWNYLCDLGHVRYSEMCPLNAYYNKGYIHDGECLMDTCPECSDSPMLVEKWGTTEDKVCMTEQFIAMEMGW